MHFCSKGMAYWSIFRHRRPSALKFLKEYFVDIVANGGTTPGRARSGPCWKIHRPGSSPGSSLLSPVYCFASVIVWTENKNVTISYRFICFILTVKRHWRHVFWGRQLKKSTFLGKKCIRVTRLEDFLTSKWPGSFTALAPPLVVANFNTSIVWPRRTRMSWGRLGWRRMWTGSTCYERMNRLGTEEEGKRQLSKRS